MTDTKEKSSPKSNKKIMFLGIGAVAVLFAIILITTIGGLAIAYNSNKNVPFLSDAVERIENTVLSDEQFSKLVQSSISDNLFSNIEQVSNIDSNGQLLNDEKIEGVLENDVEIDSYKFDVDIRMDTRYEYNSKLTSAAANEYQYDININGAVNGKDKENPSMDLIVDANVLVNGDTTTGNGQITLKDNKVYMILNELNLSEPEAQSPFNDFIAKWFSIDMDSEYLDSLNTNEDEISAEDMQKLKDIINSEVVSKNIKRLPDEVISGVRTYCLEFSLDQESYIELSKEIYRVYGMEWNNDVAEGVGDIKFNACIGRRDNLLYKMGFEVAFSDNTDSYNMDAEFFMNFTISDYNTDIEINAPEESTDIIEMIQEQQRKIQQTNLERERRYKEMMKEYEQY